MSSTAFIWQAITNFGTTGSPLPSQKSLVERMTAPIVCEPETVIVELGAGTGVITEKIAEKMLPENHLFVLDNNRHLLAIARKNLKGKGYTNRNIHCINEDATNMKSALSKHEVSRVNYIVSSLPLANMPAEKRNTLLRKVSDFLYADGIYMQYQYSWKNYSDVQRFFRDINVSFVPCNFPPAFVYTCRKHPVMQNR